MTIAEDVVEKTRATKVHPSAVVHPSAKLAPDVEVGPFTWIGPDVQIGSGTVVGPHVVIRGPTTIGDNNRIYQFASIGEDPQDKKYQGGESRLEIGSNNIIREFVTINRGTEHGGGLTSIGDHNLLMSYVHIAHDCRIGNHIVFSNNAQLAGHVRIDDHVILSGFVGVRQFCEVGTRAFLAGGSMVVKDVPPYVTVSGYPAKVFGLNTIGLRRAGFSEVAITMIRRAYKILYRQGLSLSNALSEMQPLMDTCPEVKVFVDFIQQERSLGIIR